MVSSWAGADCGARDRWTFSVVVKIVDKSCTNALNASCESIRSGTANLYGEE
jgi:hypothetical protein